MHAARPAAIQRIVLALSIVFVLVSGLGFLATGLHAGPMPSENMSDMPMIIGLFPVNWAHNLVHLAFGIWGLWASRSARAATRYSFASGVLYFGLALLGVFAPTMFGLVPIGGMDIPLHAVLALVMIGAAFWALISARPEVAEATAGD